MDWIQVFRTGRHTDAAGDEREWGIADLDRIISSYNPVRHEAPVVIGHPEDSAPAFGWVEALKRDGEILYAKLKDMVPEFVDMVRRGLYKKRSIALYPDLTLRHVGFLGAMPPSIKGLEDVQFQERAKNIICFSDIEWEGGVEVSNSETIVVEKDFDTAVQRVMREKKVSKAKAIEFCAREYPELHHEYVVNLSAKPEEELRRRTDENLLNPLHFDKDGRRDRERRIYSEAYEYVKDKNPELAQRFAEKMHPQISPEEEKSLAAGRKIVSLIQAKMKTNKGFTYSEALDLVQKENRGLVLEFIGRK